MVPPFMTTLTHIFTSKCIYVIINQFQVNQSPILCAKSCALVEKKIVIKVTLLLEMLCTNDIYPSTNYTFYCDD